MKLIDADNFSNEFNSKIFNKLQNEYLNSTADDKTKDIADFVTTDIMTVFNYLIDNAPTVEKRSQGEWTNTSPYDDKGECPFCCYLSKKYYKFCPYCGAKMG